ncbi:MAG: Mor transcription activator family protein [Nitrincola lacisaponensis]|uniref:Mor transcription activator family protein n=1 Tax=Nitrincola lacisaponensis TaxID=267850 RepID=UPI0039191494
MSSQMEKRRHELLEDVSAHASQIIINHGVDADIANQVGIAIADHLARHWGGQMITIPKDYFFGIAKRDAEIWAKFNGRNQSDLARQYGMTLRGIYKVLDRMRSRDTTQPELF